MITERTTCRACGGPFDPLLNLGTPVLSDFVKPDEPDPPRVPLDVVVCQRCDLVQLRHTVDPDSLYRKYWYLSGINEAMREELRDVAATVRETLQIENGTVIDIGANDGTLLSHFPPSWNRIGVEPALNIQPLVSASRWIREFFPCATSEFADHSIEAITSVAMFYDLDDPKAFVAEVDRLLTQDGVWICQFQDLGQQVATNAFDNFVAEHLCYYTPHSFDQLLDNTDLYIAAIERRAINGGSLRFIVRRRLGMHPLPDLRGEPISRDALDHFAWRIGEYRDQLLGVIDHVLAQGQMVDLYAASTKSSTLLQFCGIDHGRIRFAVERTQAKVGLVTSGTRIPVISEEDWRVDPAPVALCGAYQFLDQFLRRENDFLNRGGSFLTPLPSPRLIYGSKP